MAYILNIETATKNCSVSLARNGKTLACKEIATESYAHSEKLHLFIEEIITDSEIQFSDLAAIAVSKGPGSYTGLRIGVSAAKGLCFALEIPLISVETLKVLAAQLSIKEGIILPMIDARRMEVYSAHYNSQLMELRTVEAEVIDENSYVGINEKIYIVGDCQEKLRPILNGENIIYNDQVVYPSAREMSKLSFEKFNSGHLENTAYFEPFYLKDFLVSTPKKI